ncbi:MAG: DoxX family protein [Bacteroidota bacterium]
MKILEKYRVISDSMKHLEFLPLFLMRLAIAYSLFGYDLSGGGADYFASQWASGFPATGFSLWFIVYAKILLIVLVIAGFATRLVSASIIIVLLVSWIVFGLATGVAHPVSRIELSLTHILLLLTLAIFGAGKLSIDYCIKTNQPGKLHEADTGIPNGTGNGNPDLYCRAYEDF